MKKSSFSYRLRTEYSQLLVPLIAIALLLAFNLIRDLARGALMTDASFFSINLLTNSNGDLVLSGNLISVLDGASELAILAMGMTLVTAACGGQDISVGALAAIAGSVFVKVLKGVPMISGGAVLLAFLASCLVAMIFGAFNGTLVSVFKIQPMIATLILYTCGRSVAYWINGGATPQVDSPIVSALGKFIPGIPMPTPVLIVVLCAVIFGLVFRFTTLGLLSQSVGINQRAARLNGINTTWIKLLSFIILGACCSVSGLISVGRLGLINHKTILQDVEMDAILAVAIGGNALSGGKFKMIGSVLGAYAIEMLTTTLLAMRVRSTDIKAYKAVVIILLVVVGSPAVKNMVTGIVTRIKSGSKKVTSAGKEAA